MILLAMREILFPAPFSIIGEPSRMNKISAHHSNIKTRNHKLNLYGTNIEVDYRGYEVSVENFLRVLTGSPLLMHRSVRR